MSTIPEVLVAKEEGMNVMVLSLVTNKVVIPNEYRSIKAEVEAEVWSSNDLKVITDTVLLLLHSSLESLSYSRKPRWCRMKRF